MIGGALWLPALRSAADGDLDVGAAALRLGLAIALGWCACAAFAHLLGRYRAVTPAHDAVDEHVGEPGLEAPADRYGRRRDDVPVREGSSTPS